MKKFLCVLFAGLVLAGCSNSTSQQEQYDESKTESQSTISSVSLESASSESVSSSKVSSSSKSSSSSKNVSSVKELTHREQSDKSSSENSVSKTSVTSSEQSISTANSTKENTQPVLSTNEATNSTVSINEKESEKITAPSEAIKEPEPQAIMQPQQGSQNNIPQTRSKGNLSVPVSAIPSDSPAISSTTTPPQSFISSEEDLSGLQNLSEVPDTETTPQQAAGDTRTAYWTPGGKSYHFSKNCTSLKRSKTINSGTVQDAVNAGKSDPCNLCANG